MENKKQFDDLLREEIVLSTPEFVLTKKFLVSGNDKIYLSDVESIQVQDNKRKVNTSRWIAITVISGAIFAYDLNRKGRVDIEDVFLVPLIVAGIVYFVTSPSRETSLVVRTTSGDEHIIATVGIQNISLENVHEWCGIISAARVDWERK